MGQSNFKAIIDYFRVLSKMLSGPQMAGLIKIEMNLNLFCKQPFSYESKALIMTVKYLSSNTDNFQNESVV